MIAKISGKLVEKSRQSVIINVNGIFYEIFVPISVLERIDEHRDDQGLVTLIIYHYLQIEPSRGVPLLIGFLSGIEKDFFLQFIKVSGIGPKAAVRALNQPIAEISEAIDQGNVTYLKNLPGIGAQRAKEIVAKLQGKVSRFGLIPDKGVVSFDPSRTPDWQEEALQVLLQLQYKKQEALTMIKKVLEHEEHINTAEDLLNEIYKQKVNVQ